jgi:hypothetical protein
MHKTILLTTTIALLLTPKIAIAAPALTEESRLGTNGIGPLHVGMTIGEAEEASGRRFKVQENPLGGTCTYATIRGLEGVSVMLIKGIIERVDIRNPNIMTLRGAKVGDSEKRINILYPNQIKTTVHPYTGRSGGHYLTFYPKDREDQDYRIIFETSKGKVYEYRSGRVPAVDYIEGCS